MTAIIIVAAYAASLVSFLTSNAVVFPVNNLQEVLDKKYKIGLLQTSGLYNLLKVSIQNILVL